MSCIYCKSSGPFSTIEHAIPESLGNDDLLLRDCVCDACQAYFGKEVEQYVLAKTPLGVWRALIGIRGKKGKLPIVDTSQPTKTKGRLSDTHPYHDNLVYSARDDGSSSVHVVEGQALLTLLNGEKRQFNLVLTPKKLSMMSRFLGKVGIGVLATADLQMAMEVRFDALRNYARQGDVQRTWPLFHFSDEKSQSWKKPKLLGPTGDVLLEEVECYSYVFLEVAGYTLFRFSIGTDNWVICMDDRYPSPAIRGAFPEKDLKLIWYGR